MLENELSKPAKIAIAGCLLVMLPFVVVAVLRNAAQGVVPRPWAFLIVLAGFACFMFPKSSVIRNKRLISFGTRLMTQDQGNSYRLGYWLMGVGLLSTFL